MESYISPPEQINKSVAPVIVETVHIEEEVVENNEEQPSEPINGQEEEYDPQTGIERSEQPKRRGSGGNNANMQQVSYFDNIL
jgi:hypothetical protein